jgi:hypothetical protein
MESKGRRTPRMAAPADASTPLAAPEATEPVRVDKPAEETVAPADVVVQRISPPLPVPLPAPAPAALPSAEVGRDIFDIIAESRAALARGVEAMSDEFASFARHSIDTTARMAIRMLGVRTWADAVALNASFARTSFDHWLDSTAKVSELGVKLAVESSRPFAVKLGKAWGSARLGR